MKPILHSEYLRQNTLHTSYDFNINLVDLFGVRDESIILYILAPHSWFAHFG